MQNMESKFEKSQHSHFFLLFFMTETDVVKLGLCVIIVSHEQISLSEAH